MPPNRVPRIAVFSSLALVTRWKTSCWAIEPSAIVRKAANSAMTSFASKEGSTTNLPSPAAADTTRSKPPAWPPSSTAMYSRPSTMITVWKRSVSATAHMPPISR